MDEKKTRDGKCSIDRSRGERAISSNEDVFFIFWFQSINLQCSSVGVYKDNKGRVDIEKVDKANRVDKTDRVEGVNEDKADRADRADKGRADVKEPDGVDGGRADIKEPDEIDRANRDRVDGANRGGADVEKLDRDGADIEELDRPSIIVGDPSL